MLHKNKILHSILTGLVLFCITTSAFAQLTFQKAIGGTTLDYAYDMQKTSDGGYVYGGIISSLPGPYFTSYVVKTDANGDTLWTSSYGDSCGQYINDIVQNSD